MRIQSADAGFLLPVKRFLLFFCWFASFILPFPVSGQEADEIDWGRARQLFQRAQRGEALEPADQAYLDRAKALRQRGARPGPDGGTAVQREAPARLTPLCDMTATDRYEGEDGGIW